MSQLVEALWRNQGQTLTPELIAGILQISAYAPPRYLDFTGIAPVERNGYVFHVERYEAVLGEIKPLHNAHWLETEKHRHGVPFNMDYAALCRLDHNGQLVLFTIRKDGELVGQGTMVLHVSRHSQTLVGNEDSLFLRSDHRGGLMMLFFIKYVDAVLSQLGVKEVRVSVKSLNRADKLMVRAGYKPTATQLVKMLGDANAQPA